MRSIDISPRMQAKGIYTTIGNGKYESYFASTTDFWISWEESRNLSAKLWIGSLLMLREMIWT